MLDPLKLEIINLKELKNVTLEDNTTCGSCGGIICGGAGKDNGSGNLA